MEDTIFAPSSAIGGAIAVLRVSGPEARKTAALFDRDATKMPRRLVHACLYEDGELLDDCMCAFLPGPNTYTGEDTFEIHCHGGMRTVQRALGALSRLGFRAAQAGEFTKRAFLNGRMDLSAAEAVMDVINAEAEQSLKAALLQLHGSVKREIDSLEALLLDALSSVDAALDYPDETEADVLAAMPGSLAEALGRVELLIAESRRGRVLRDGLRVAIVGRPNVGKSSLLNALLGEERAIVTAEAGTTRDLIDARCALNGVPVRLVDTAGIREAENEVERIGVSRAREALRMADVSLVILDGSMPLTRDDWELLSETAGQTRLLAINKCDLPQRARLEQPHLCVSARTGEGLSALVGALLALAAPERADGAYITNERHIRALEQARDALRDAQNASELDCAATDMRNALHQLGLITGTDADAEVIERIFARFCVGK